MMNKPWAVIFALATFSVLQLSPVDCSAQEIPLGTWRSHNSYNSIHAIALSTTKVYAASSNGIVVVDPSDNSFSAITKVDGLSSTDISSIAFDLPRNQLLISYADGMLDIVRTNEIISYSKLKNSTTITGSKRINDITIRNGFAYLAADYGVVVFDLTQLEVKETWRDLGSAGQALRIFESAFLNDSIFLATEVGVLAGDISDNLLDFAKWKRFNQGPFNGAIESVASFNNKVYAAIDGSGLFAYEAGAWVFVNFSGSDFKNLSTGSNLLVIEGLFLWKLNATGTLTKIENGKLIQPLCAIQDSGDKLWVGDSRNGVVSDKTGSFESFIPNGPTFSGSFRMVSTSTQLYSVSGGYSGLSPSGKNEFVNTFSSGLWSSESALITTDVTDVDFSPSKKFISSFGSGLQVVEFGASTLYTNSNSPISNNQVSAVAYATAGLWVANYAVSPSLHLLKNDNTWESFSFPVGAAPYPTEMVVDRLGQVWMVLNPSFGGGIIVFNKEMNKHVYLTDASGSGGLPSRSVYSVAVDRDGQVWVGTSSGVAYFPNPSLVFSGNINSSRPIFNGRFLLRDETVTAIAVDGGNRKWMGTQRGVWLFDPFGEKQIHNFTLQNSPLLSEKIVDIDIQPSTGEVFFGTDKGIISYRADATESTQAFSSVKIFPNPVTASFSGVVSISGLSTNATIKVTDISGKLIWQTYANGGTATWDVRDYTGRRASTGMYLVISISQDTSESIVGKIAVIN